MKRTAKTLAAVFGSAAPLVALTPSPSSAAEPARPLARPVASVRSGVDADADAPDADVTDADAPLTPDPGPYFAPGEAMPRAAACMGDQYQVRGGSLVPPDNGKLVYWDAGGAGYEVRYMNGIECLGDGDSYFIDYGNTAHESGYSSSYGRRIVTKQGAVYEGCKRNDPTNRYWCDFSANRNGTRPSRLVPDKSSVYFWRVLREWTQHTATTTASCGKAIVGLWVGTDTITGVGTACYQKGPYTPGS